MLSLQNCIKQATGTKSLAREKTHYQMIKFSMKILLDLRLEPGSPNCWSGVLHHQGILSQGEFHRGFTRISCSDSSSLQCTTGDVDCAYEATVGRNAFSKICQ
jgi:hypothetical protein